MARIPSLGLAASLLLPGPAQGQAPVPRTLHVDAEAPGVVEDGVSWSTAYRKLDEALGAAINGDEIWVANGSYTPGTAREDSFVLKTGVSVYGGFEGFGATIEETTRDERNPDPETNGTILSGDLNGDDGADFAFTDDNCYQVVTGTHATSGSILDGFTIRGGNASLAEGRRHLGGGIICDGGGNPSLVNLLVTENQAALVGGAMYLNASNASCSGVTFHANRTSQAGSGVTGEGGAIYLNLSSPFFVGCRFLGNEAAKHGGAISSHGSTPTFFNCLLSGNTTAGSGGALYSVTGSDASLVNCTVVGNTAPTGQAGAFYLNGGTWTFTNSIAYDNSDAGSPITEENLKLVNGAIANRSFSFVHGIFDQSNGNVLGADLTGLPSLFIDPDGADDVAGTLDDNLRLNPGTQLVGAGDQTVYSGIYAQIREDLDGHPRQVPQGIELGAYELQALQLNTVADYHLAAPLAEVAIREPWFETLPNHLDEQRYVYLITPNGSSGTIDYRVAPEVNSDGVLSFALEPDTFGSSSFLVRLHDLTGEFADSPPISFDIEVGTDGGEASQMQPSYALKAYINVFGPYPGGSEPASPGVLGEVKFFAGTTPSAEYVPAEGQILPITSNTALFSLLGTTYGGDGSSSFGLPDLRGRVPIGAGSGPGLPNFQIGQTGGNEEVPLDLSTLPVHRHDSFAEATDLAGLGQPLSKRQPYLALHPVLVLNGQFPSIGSIPTGTETAPFIGEVRWFAGANLFFDWTLCNGSLLPISQFSAVFSLLGTTFGGDGVTSFGLPDLRGRAAIVSGTGSGLTLRQVGEKPGSESETLSTSSMPTHSHVLPAGGLAGAAGGAAQTETLMPSLVLRSVVCSATGEVRLMATANEVLGGAPDGDGGRPDIRGRVIMGESPTHPADSSPGQESVPLTLPDIDFHTHQGPAYLEWIARFFPGEDDHDVVGLDARPAGLEENLIRFVLDADPREFDGTILPEFARDEDSVTYVFRRYAESTSWESYVEYGSDLMGWTRAEHDVDGVTVVIEPDGFGPGVDRVTVTIPTQGAQRLFARLAVRLAPKP